MTTNKNVLLVDESKASAEGLSDVLKKMGLNVMYARTGSDAVKLVRQTVPDIMLIDAAPNGPEVLMAVRKEVNLTTVPAIMVSSSMNESLLKRCASAGSNGFIARPVKADVLHELMQELMSKKAGFKRRHMRVGAKLKVILTKDGAPNLFTTDSISEGGLLVRIPKPYPLLSDVHVTIGMPAGDMKLKGLVIYHTEMFKDKTTGMAVEFVGMRDEDTQAIRNYVYGMMSGEQQNSPSLASGSFGVSSGLGQRMA